MRRLQIAIASCLALAWAGMASAGVDQAFVKPEGEKRWGQIFGWATESAGFDKSYALVIGISDYVDGFEPLHSTKNDPIRMRDFLLDEAGFDYVHVLTDEKATHPRIRELMEGEFADLVGPTDRFLFYWSGHGTQTQDALGRPLGYLPVAASKPDAFWSMVSMDDLARWDRRIRARHALFLLDACFSGLAGSQAKATTQDFTIKRLAKPAHHLITAGTGAEQTIAGDRWHGSIFTDSIIRAARGEADAQSAFPRDGVVNLAELMAFVRQRIDHERRMAGWDAAITPQWNHLRSNQGEFFFVTREKKLAMAERDGSATGDFEHGMPVIVMGTPQNDGIEPPPTSTVILSDERVWNRIKDGNDSAEEGAPPIHACDLMAAYPRDPERVAPGVEQVDINSGAIQSCQEAVRGYPSEIRFKAQLGRALAEEKRYSEAAPILLEAAAKGSTLAQGMLGGLYFYGNGVKKDYNEALKWHQAAAEKNLDFSQSTIAWMHLNGQGLEQNYSKALELYRKAASQGYTHAEGYIGHIYYHGLGVQSDYDEAEIWLKKAAEKNDTHAQALLGWLYNQKGNGSEAFYWTQKAAEKGESSAQNNLGWFYQEGIGTRKDRDQAISWYRKAAEQGHIRARDNLKNIGAIP